MSRKMNAESEVTIWVNFYLAPSAPGCLSSMSLLRENIGIEQEIDKKYGRQPGAF